MAAAEYLVERAVLCCAAHRGTVHMHTPSARGHLILHLHLHRHSRLCNMARSEAFSNDTRQILLNLYASRWFTVHELAEIAEVSPRTIYRIVEHWSQTGMIQEDGTRTGQNRLLGYADVQVSKVSHFLFKLIAYHDCTKVPAEFGRAPQRPFSR